MITITQLGHKFRYRKKENGSPAIVETWDIERVAAFMFVIELHRLISQRYLGRLTFINHIGATDYQLTEFDKETNRDLNKLFGLLSSYTEPPLSYQFYTSFDKALDLADSYIRDAVKRAEEPVEIRGVVHERPRFLERPSEEEYEQEMLEKGSDAIKQAKEEDPTKVITCYFEHYGVLPCIIVHETPKSYFVDAYLKNEKIFEKSKIDKNSSRYIEGYNYGQ